MRIAGVTILFNPGIEIMQNILSYLDQVERLYIIDNSDEINKNVINNLKSFCQIIEIPNKSNVGIAAALNKAAEKALQDGFDLLLTMDQDSKVSENLVSEMLKEFEYDEKIGVLSPFVIHVENPRKPVNLGLEKITVAMTSGSIIRLSIYEKIGGFLEKLFIDYVDNEFCLRMISYGYKVLQLNSVFVYHKLGETNAKKFIWKKIFPTYHTPIRWYYRTRNRFYVYKKYKAKFPKYIKFDKIVFLKDFTKIFLYEDYKIEKLKMIIRGYFDYRKNKFDKFN